MLWMFTPACFRLSATWAREPGSSPEPEDQHFVADRLVSGLIEDVERTIGIVGGQYHRSLLTA